MRPYTGRGPDGHDPHPPVTISAKQTLIEKWHEILVGLKDNGRRVTVGHLGGSCTGDIIDVEELIVILDEIGMSDRHFIALSGICSVTRSL